MARCRRVHTVQWSAISQLTARNRLSRGEKIKSIALFKSNKEADRRASTYRTICNRDLRSPLERPLQHSRVSFHSPSSSCEDNSSSDAERVKSHNLRRVASGDETLVYSEVGLKKEKMKQAGKKRKENCQRRRVGFERSKRKPRTLR